MNEIPGRKRRWFWPLLVAAVIFVASSRSHVAAPEITNVDKYGHFLVYGLLATLTARVGNGGRAAAAGLIVASIYGLTDEWHQSFVPGRSCDFWDWAADTSGAALAVTLYGAWPWYRGLLERNLRQRRIENAAPAATLAGQ